jgi:hypothetical protein
MSKAPSLLRSLLQLGRHPLYPTTVLASLFTPFPLACSSHPQLSVPCVNSCVTCYSPLPIPSNSQQLHACCARGQAPAEALNMCG